jgi:PEP-CTERM motif
MRKAKLVKITLLLIGYTALALRAEEMGYGKRERSVVGASVTGAHISGFASAAEKKFAGVPEPGTLGLLGLGLIAMAVGLRRKA